MNNRKQYVIKALKGYSKNQLSKLKIYLKRQKRTSIIFSDFTVNLMLKLL